MKDIQSEKNMKVLFICEGNMMRSQMAEAFYNTLTGTNSAFSAGAMAALKDHIAERAKIVMDEISVSTDGMRSDQLTEKMVEQADLVVYFPTPTMPNYVLESPKAVLWDVIDPHYHQEEGIELVRSVRDEIKERVEQLLRSKTN